MFSRDVRFVLWVAELVVGCMGGWYKPELVVRGPSVERDGDYFASFDCRQMSCDARWRWQRANVGCSRILDRPNQPI